MTLESIYINEAKRIRKVYMTNLTNIVEKEDEIQIFLKMINDIKIDIEDNDDYENNEKLLEEKLNNINKNINKIKNHIMPYYEEIKKLDGIQRTLYNNIKDKYPSITDDEIQEQIVPHIRTIDLDFINKNQKIYQKIANKSK